MALASDLIVSHLLEVEQIFFDKQCLYIKSAEGRNPNAHGVYKRDA
jgi:hypothetical protein